MAPDGIFNFFLMGFAHLNLDPKTLKLIRLKTQKG